MAGPNLELSFENLFDLDMSTQGECQSPNRDNDLLGGFHHFPTEPEVFDLVADAVSGKPPLPDGGMAASNPHQTVDPAHLLSAPTAPAVHPYALDAGGFDLGQDETVGDYDDLIEDMFNEITAGNFFSGLATSSETADSDVPLFPPSPQPQQPTASAEQTASPEEQVPPSPDPSNAAPSLREIRTTGSSPGGRQGAATTPLAGFQGALPLPSTPPPKAASSVLGRLESVSSCQVNQKLAEVHPQAPVALELPSAPVPEAAQWGLDDLADFFSQGPEQYIAANPQAALEDSLRNQSISHQTALAVGSIAPGGTTVTRPYFRPSQTNATNIAGVRVRAGSYSGPGVVQAPTRGVIPAAKTGLEGFDPALYGLSIPIAEAIPAQVPGQLLSPVGPSGLGRATRIQPAKIPMPAQAPMSVNVRDQRWSQKPIRPVLSNPMLGQGNRHGSQFGRGPSMHGEYNQPTRTTAVDGFKRRMTPKIPQSKADSPTYSAARTPVSQLYNARRVSRSKFNPHDYDVPRRPRTWGTAEKPDLFTYTEHGEWSEEVRLSKQEASHYIHRIREQGRTLKIWIQHLPMKYTKRLPKPWSGKCRYRDCPALNRTIVKGFYRVTFDERPETSGRSTDPFLNAGYMHLHCLEKIFDLIELVNFGVAELDTRIFTREDKNPMSMLHHQPRLRQVYEKWRAEQARAHAQHYAQRQARGWPRDTPKREKLWYVLSRRTVEYESCRMQKVRAACKGMSMDKHLGDLDKYVAGMKKRKLLNRTAIDQIARETEFISKTPSPPRVGMRRAVSSDAWAFERGMKRVRDEYEDVDECEDEDREEDEEDEEEEEDENEEMEQVVVVAVDRAGKRQCREHEATASAPTGMGLDSENDCLFLGYGEHSHEAGPWSTPRAAARTKWKKADASEGTPWDADLRQPQRQWQTSVGSKSGLST